jgi:hypothetical protein
VNANEVTTQETYEEEKLVLENTMRPEVILFFYTQET